MMKKISAFIPGMVLLKLGLLIVPEGFSQDRPNIIFILSDDHGWADLGVNGVDHDVKTPNTDQLARDGVRFTRGYVTAPQCPPSREKLPEPWNYFT